MYTGLLNDVLVIRKLVFGKISKTGFWFKDTIKLV